MWSETMKQVSVWMGWMAALLWAWPAASQQAQGQSQHDADGEVREQARQAGRQSGRVVAIDEHAGNAVLEDLGRRAAGQPDARESLRPLQNIVFWSSGTDTPTFEAFLRIE